MLKKLLIGTLLFLTGIGVGIVGPPSSGAETPVFVNDGPSYEGQKKLLADFVKASLERDTKGCADLYAENAIYMVAETPVLEANRRVLGCNVRSAYG